MTKTYDPKCEALARHFLGDTRMADDLHQVRADGSEFVVTYRDRSEQRVRDLAYEIQRSIEDWIASEKAALDLALGVGQTGRVQ